MARVPPSLSKRLIASYAIDWLFLVIFALIAYGFSLVTPHYHNFSVLDLTLSQPIINDTVPIWLAALVAGIIPAGVIVVVSLVAVPGPAVAGGRPLRSLLRLKLWEWHVGWLGLGMSLAVSLMTTQGLKNFGKPRPNMLARCQPDLNNLEKYVVGGYGQDVSPRWTIVTEAICQQTDSDILGEGFQSWPSGHATLAWAGLLYLTLWLCSKFAVVLPYLPPTTFRPSQRKGTKPGPPENGTHAAEDVYTQDLIQHRDEAAGPPVYLLLFIVVPVGAALYISLSRYMDYAHFGFDIFCGSIIGIVCAYVSFRWYHLPIARGSGWSWGPRSPDRAFGVGVGRHGFVDEGRFSRSQDSDTEMALFAAGSGHEV